MAPRSYRPIGYQWTETTADGHWMATYEIVGYVEQRDGSLREEKKRVGFVRLPVARVGDERGSA